MRRTFIALFLIVGSAGAVAEAAPPKPTKLTLSATTKVLAVGQTYTAKVKAVKPAKASKAVTWRSSNRKVATVSAKGKIKALKTGKVTIKATSKVSRKVTAKLTVTVRVNAGTAPTPTPGPTAPAPAPTPTPAPVIDPQLLGSWSIVSSSGGVFTTYNADGTWLRVVIIKTSFSHYENTSKGNYRAEGGKIYSTGTIYQSRDGDSGPWSEWKPAAEPNRIENYAIGTDEYGEYLVTEDDPNPVTEESVKYRRD